MRVLLSTYGSRGDVEPMVGLAVELRALGAEAQVCAPPDFAGLLDQASVPLVPAGQSVQAMVREVFAGKKPPSPADLAGGVIAAQFDAVAGAVASAAGGCDVIVTGGLTTAAAGTRAAAEKLGVRYLYAAYATCYLPSPHYPPLVFHGQQAAPDETDNLVLWDQNARGLQAAFGAPVNAFRASLGLPAVDNVRDHAYTDHPWLAADPVLAPWPGSRPGAGPGPAGLDVVQTGAWTRPDERPLPATLEAFLNAGAPPVYVSFGSMPLREADTIARAVIEAVRSQDRRVLLGTGWADLALIDDGDDCLAVGEVNQQALFRRVAAVVHHGGAGTTTTAAQAGAPQVVVPQVADQPYWASRVADLGLGVAHDGPVPTAESLSAALEIALAPAVAARAAAVAGTVRTDGAQLAAKLLLDMIAQRSAAVTAGRTG
jgi:vancomycin aglycone glucosyltransferase